MKIGFLGLLAILFIGLKLTGYVAWSWLWVLAPIWIGPALIIAVPSALAIGGLGAATVGDFMDRRKRKLKAPR